MQSTEKEESFIRRCLELAKLGAGATAPNPMVGAVIVYNGRIIGEGFHETYGGPHAEVNAIGSVMPENFSKLSESTLYVSLEPCSHHGKTPPCADGIIAHHIPEVVIASEDPNPLVSGNGIRRLEENGVKVRSGILADEAKFLNRRFYGFHSKKRPYITLKWAQSIDGFIGRENEETGISNEFARRLVHKWRSENMAVMVGTGTAQTDNPKLDTRYWPQGKSPIRLVLDRQLRLPDHLHLFDRSIPTIVITAQEKPARENLKFVKVSFDQHLLPFLLEYLFSENIQSILVEGGAKLLQTFIDEGLWDEAFVLSGNLSLGHGIAAPVFKGNPAGEFALGDTVIRSFRNDECFETRQFG